MKKTGLSRKTPLTAKTGLTTRTELSRGSELTRASSLPRGVHVPRPRSTAQRGSSTGRSDQGTPIPRDLAAWILERAEDCCDWCGAYCLNGPYSRQHRAARGMGGRSGANTAENLVLLCGTANSPGGCHLRCEHDDLDAAREAGFRLRPGEDPAATPIHRHGVSWVLPTSEGWTPVVLRDGLWVPVGDTMRSA